MPKLSPGQRTKLLREIKILRELDRRNRQRLFYHIYPEEDQVQGNGDTLHSRHKYAKHMEFFEAGADYRERCAMAANRCLTPWTFIETEGGETLSAEAWTSADARVQSLAGESRCVVRPRAGLFLGIEQAFRVVMDSGRFFDCSRRHRVLTSEGLWRDLDQLVHLSSGLRCWHERSDYQASCDADGYLGDQPLHQIGGIDLKRPPTQDDAQKRAPFLFSLEDATEPTLQYIRACPPRARLSTRDDLRRFAGLFGHFAGPSSSSRVLRLIDSNLAHRRLASASCALPQSGGVSHCGQFGEGASPALAQMQCHDGSCTMPTQSEARRSDPLSCDAQDLHGSISEWFRDKARIPIFYPSDHPSLFGGDRIVAIVPLGLQPIIDAHMPETNNYFAAGVCHHNTGKTLGMGGYEMAAHLTGEYPEWWNGRRFTKPIRAWAAGKTNETTRDIVQSTLLGEVVSDGSRKSVTGTGIIPGERLGRVAWKQGVQDLVDTIKVKHVSGSMSVLGLKSYQQGRGSFEGTSQHAIWLDEEPPLDVYGECLIRTATTNGILMLTFTPLAGMSETVIQFLPADMRPQAPEEV